ncbi:MAG: SLC13 family permease [Planctomycetota bacterium]
MLPVAPVLGLVIGGASLLGGMPSNAAVCAAVAVVCATWWIFECLHIAAVGLVPFVVLPLAGILTHREVAASYGHTMILLLMGGFLLSAAMERSGAHRRIAVMMVRAVGGAGGKRLVLGFMLATASLSMWISNTATALMMLPIAMAVLSQCRDDQLKVPLLLAIAYSASVGGMATPVGTPPNVIFMGQLEERFDTEMSFFEWMKFGLPITLILLPTIWWWVTRNITSNERVEMPEPGPLRPNELRVLLIFSVTALLWVFRTGPYGGWSAWMPRASAIGDSTIALAASLAVFVCPSGVTPEDGDNNGPERPVDRLLDWETAKKGPWGILLMFGGGLALADGFEESGLSAAIGSQFSFLTAAPAWLIVMSICLVVTFLTEITSSTATATLLLPILAELSEQVGLPPQALMVPGTISCSCAFMLPVATAPNVIVFGTGMLRTDQMARMGLMLNLIAALVITLWTMLLLPGYQAP